MFLYSNSVMPNQCFDYVKPENQSTAFSQLLINEYRSLVSAFKMTILLPTSISHHWNQCNTFALELWKKNLYLLLASPPPFFDKVDRLISHDCNDWVQPCTSKHFFFSFRADVSFLSTWSSAPGDITSFSRPQVMQHPWKIWETYFSIFRLKLLMIRLPCEKSPL